MGRYIARRLYLMTLVLWVAVTITFFLAYLVPGDPARLMAGAMAPPAQVEAMRKELGLDAPVPVQYVRYLRRVVRGDLGISVHTRRPVRQDLREFFAATFELTTAAMILAVIAGVPLGILSAVRRDTMTDHIGRLVALAGVSVPVFLLGTLLQLAFSVGWPVLPLGGRVATDDPVTPITNLYLLDAVLRGNWAGFRSAATHLVLPALTLAYPSLSLITRMVRASMLEVIGQDYVRTARAIGLTKQRVIYRHALPNALIPTMTILALAYGYALTGTFLVENVFAWPGLGRYAAFSIINADYPAILGVTVVSALIYIMINLLVDLGYACLDPRVRYT